MRVQIVYSSRTGNTEKLAKTIFAAVPEKEKNIKRIEERTERDDGEIYLVGFWTEYGSASGEILDFLGSLHGKKVALFGTCGMGGSEAYYRQIERNVSAFLPEDCEYLGAFFCQGKMPIQVRNHCEAVRTPGNRRQVDFMVHHFDEALLHPDNKDMEDAVHFVQRIFFG